MMKKKTSLFQSAVIIVILAILLIGCRSGDVNISTPTPQPPAINLILNPNISDVLAGQTVALSVNVSGQDIKVKWSVARGTLSILEGPSVLYTPPTTPGVDTVTVDVSSAAGSTIKTVTFNVIVPATDTPPPVDTPIPTSVPDPVACNVPAVTKDVFPQLAEVSKQFPFYGPVNDSRVICEGVYDIFHNKPMSVRIEYENVEKNFAFWGIGVPKEFPFDVSSYSKICFWAFAKKPNQSFRLKMRDTSPPPNEDGLTIILPVANEWISICTDLTKFSDLGLQLNSLENINLGFEQPTGSAEIWIDDFELK